MKKYKDVFTTGEVAKICRISQQTVIRLFDKNKLRGYKIPGSRFRRIPLKYLIVFMKEYKLPLEWLNSEEFKSLETENMAPAISST